MRLQDSRCRSPKVGTTLLEIPPQNERAPVCLLRLCACSCKHGGLHLARLRSPLALEIKERLSALCDFVCAFANVAGAMRQRGGRHQGILTFDLAIEMAGHCVRAVSISSAIVEICATCCFASQRIPCSSWRSHDFAREIARRESLETERTAREKSRHLWLRVSAGICATARCVHHLRGRFSGV